MKQTPSSQPSRFYTRNLNPMKTPMKKSVINLFGALAFVALSTISVQAATITWNTPVTVSGDTDVATTGNPLYAYNGANSTASVNGVSFTGESSTATWGSVGISYGSGGGGNYASYGASGSPWNSLSANYQTVLKGGDYANTGGSAITVTLNSLTSGHQYLVQIWVNDSRAGTSRSEAVVGGGGNTVTLNYNNTTAAGGVGQYTIGTFTASATSQTFTLTGAASSQLNAIQVRDITGGYFSGASGTVWDASTTSDWGTISGGPYNQTWSTASSPVANAIFEGTANTVTVNGSVSVGNITFTTDGYTLANGTSGALAWTGGSITTGSGSDSIGASLSGTGQLTKSGSGALTLSATTNTFTGQLQVTGGTLNWNTAAALAPTSTYQPLSVQSGGTLVVNGYLRYSSGGSGNVYAYLNVGNNASGGIGTITVNSGGSLSFTNMTSDPGSIIGQQGTGGISKLTVNGGAFNWDGSSSLAIGNGNGSGLLLITNNGTVTILAGASADDKYVALGRNSLTSTGTVYLASGTLASSCFFACGTATPIGKAYFNFDGGTLKALANQTDWLQSTIVGNNNPLTAVTIKAGGAVIDANGFNVAINNAIASGAVSDGGLTLTNSSGSTGTLTLGGICAYNGSTTVNGGILKVTGTVPTATTVNPGGAIGASSGTFSALVTLASGNSAINLLDGAVTTNTFQNGLTLNNGNQLSFDLNSSTADRISVSGGSFSHSGTVTINLNGITSFVSGTTYTLITDAANDITTTSGFVVGTTPTGYGATLGTSGGALTVTVTQNAPSVAYWKGGLDNTWNTVSGGNVNWTTDAAGTVNAGALPASPSSVIFAATGAANFSTVLGTNLTINNLTLSTANNVTIAGAANSLTLVAGLTNASTALNNVISVSNLVLSASQTFENDSTNGLTISSLIGGSSALTTAGNGTIVLTSTNNNYNGGTTVSAGTLQLGDGTANNGAVAGTVTDNSLLLIANPAAQTFANAISGTGVLGKTGSGVLTLPNANTYTGGTIISNGTVQVNNTNALGATSLGATTGTITNNGVMNLNIGGNWFFYPITGNGTINVTATANTESRFDGNMAGFTGTITVPASSGSSKVDIEGGAINWNSSATIIVSNGGTLFVESATPTNDWAGQAEQVAATIYVSGSGNSEGYGALRVDDAAVLTGNVILQGTTVYGGAYDHHGRSGISGVISDGGLGYGISCANTINGQAEEFWGANTYSGGTAWTNAAYTLVLGNGSALQNSTLNIGPGQLLFDSVVTSNAFVFGGLSGTANITLTNGTSAVALTVGNNNSSTVYNGNLSDAGMGASLTKIGTGSLTLGGVDSYSGLTTIAGGTLVLNTSQTNVTTGIAVNDGATLTVEVAGTHQLAPASYTLGSSAGPVTNGFAGLTSTTVAPVNAGSVTLNGQTIVNIIGGSFTGGQTYPLISSTGISGPGGFALGTLPRGLVANLVTNGGNTIALYVTGYVPSFDVWTGAVNTNWDINGTSNWLVSGVANTYLEGDNTWFDDTAVSTNVFVTVPVSPNSLVVSNNTTTYTFAGSAIGGAASLTKLGTGLLVLNNTNTYLGNTVISNGTVQLGGINVMPGGSGKGDVTLNGIIGSERQERDHQRPVRQRHGGHGGGRHTDLDHRQQRLQFHVQRCHSKLRRHPDRDQEWRGHADAGRQQHLLRRHHRQRRHAASGEFKRPRHGRRDRQQRCHIGFERTNDKREYDVEFRRDARQQQPHGRHGFRQNHCGQRLVHRYRRHGQHHLRHLYQRRRRV
jgi:fibronectin-binding autotransporter adhesin